MTAKYCVFGEGPNDIGIVEYGGGGKLAQEGCYAGFLKAAAPIAELECLKAVKLQDVAITSGPVKKKPISSKTRLSKKAYIASRMAATDGADILIIGRDVDRGGVSDSRHIDRVRCVGKYRDEFEEGYRLACDDEPEVKRVQLIVIVPLC